MTEEAERIASSLEPDLRQIIDMTMERVAEIEHEVMHEARAAMQRSEQGSRDAVDRSSELVSNLEALTRTVSQMTLVLRTDLDGVVATLRALHRLNVRLPADVEPLRAREPEPAPETNPEPEPDPAPEPDPPVVEAPPVQPAAAERQPEPTLPAEPTPEPEPTPVPEVEPSPELIEMFREQITRMREDGNSREEAERVLLRFRLGHRFLGMLDEIYSADAPGPGGRRRRRRFGRRSRA